MVHATQQSAGMDTSATTPRWESAEYAAELRAWVEAELGPVTMTRTKLRAWSTVWRAQAASGRYWAKQNCPSQAFEGSLTTLLAGLVPERVLTPVAVRDDGKLLLPDGGPVLRDVEGASDDLGAWCRVVGEWARLQLALVGYTDAISATGVTTLAPDALPAWARERAE